MLGDVGGLSDALLGIGGFFVIVIQTISGNQLQKYLVTTIFNEDNSHKAINKSTKEQLKLLKQRKKFPIKSNCFRRT